MEPLLLSLKLGDPYESPGLAVFDLTRNLPSISIRDQLVRATMLGRLLPTWLQAAFDKSPDQMRPVLVVGAGVSGMATAIELARRGLDVEVVDPDPRLPFSVQRGCDTRWLDAVQYDWPMDHWRHGYFPWHRWQRRRRDILPFPCGSDRARRIGTRWVTDWVDHLLEQYAQRLTYRFGEALYCEPERWGTDELVAWFCDADKPDVQIDWSPYQAIVLAFGFGTEVCRIENSPLFVGYQFWETDPLEHPFCGLPGQANQEGTVLISGTGDGGLQDFLRVMTRRASARQIYDDLDLQNAGIDLNRLASVDHRFERAAAWSMRGSQAFTRTEYCEERHDVYQREARRILSSQLNSKILGILAQSPTKTILVSRYEYFDCLYPLNLFLSILIIEALRLSSNEPSVEILSPYGVNEIRPQPRWPGPQGLLNARRCLGQPWSVTVQHTIDGTSRAPIEANVVIMRHGLDQRGDLYPEREGEQADRQAVTEPSTASYPRPMPPTHLFQP